MLQQNQANIGGKIYNITNQISLGNSGTFKEGQSQEGEKVTIKYLNTISDTEYQILQSLIQNPQNNILAIKAMEREINGKIIIVMEFANKDFYTFMTNSSEFVALSKDQRNQIFYQMVSAVKELHDLGYPHRDLKPENFVVLKGDQGQVRTKLYDLGLCQQQNIPLAQRIRNGDTPYYLAPEALDDQKNYSGKIDSWSLGCIWYELLTGNTFFSGNSQMEVFNNIRNASQLQINQIISGQQILDDREKLLMKTLILKEVNQRMQVQELDYKLQHPPQINQTQLSQSTPINRNPPIFQNNNLAQNNNQAKNNNWVTQDEKERLNNQFNASCSQVKQMLSQFEFDNNLEVIDKMRQFSCKKQLEQSLDYFKKCKDKFDENSKLFQLEMNNLKEYNFIQVKNQLLSEMIQKQNDKSARAIDDLNSFYNSSIKPHYQENFDQLQQEDEQLFQQLKQCKEIQEKAYFQSQNNSDQFQKAIIGQITNQDYINQVKRDTEELIKHQKDLQQMNLKELQQFNEKIPNKVNSWFIQMLLINIILSFQNIELVKRKYQKSEEKGNKEQCKQLLDEESELKNIMLESKNYLGNKQFSELKLEELIKNQEQLKESIDKDLSEIKNKNRIKLRGFVKNQEIVKEIIEMTQVEEYSKTIEFHKLQQLLNL